MISAMVAKVFEVDYKIDYVFNLAGETKYSQTDEVYKENILDVSITCGKAAAKYGVKRFIEVSTSQVYTADKVLNPSSILKCVETKRGRRQDQTLDQVGQGQI